MMKRMFLAFFDTVRDDSGMALQAADERSTLAHHFSRHEIEPCQSRPGRLHCTPDRRT
jgi:hypothetical protein